MGKFKHTFTLTESEESFVRYSDGKTTARIDFISESCVRAAIYKEDTQMLPTFSVNPQNEFLQNGRDKLSTEGFALVRPEKSLDGAVHKFTMPCGIIMQINTENLIISYYKGREALFSDRKPLAYNLENEFGKGAYHYVTRMKDEKIFGLGDKGGELDKSGRAFRIETSDSMGYDAEKSDPLYKHIPFYICENEVGCYGIFYDTSDDAYVDLGKEINNYYEPYKYFKSHENSLVYYVFFGSKLSVLKQFAALCGKQPLPPKWSFDYCASTMAYTDAPDSQKQMNAFIGKLKEYDLSCKGFYLSSGYTSIGNSRCVFNWNREKFPDVNGFVKEFSDAGIELIPNIKPAFLTDHPLYDYIAGKGYFVKNPDGTPFITEFWDGLGSYLDFTNENAFDFWKSKVTETLLDYGITATWNDNNEFDIKDCDALAQGFSGKTVKAGSIKPVLTYLMNMSSYKAQTSKRPNLRPFLSTRSGGIEVRRFAQTWSGDNMTRFKDLRYCHYIGLTMSLSGLYFYGHDLGGFSGDMPSRELLLRWLQHGIFEPRMTIHSWNSDGTATMPWSYPDIIGNVRTLFAQRKKLIPYLYSSAYKAVEYEEPLNAPVFLYFDDKELYSYNDTMMLGRDVLCTFVFDEGSATAKAFLPKECDWYLGDTLYSGGREVELEIAPTDSMPYFVRNGCVFPSDEAKYGFNCEEKTVFTVYPLKEGEFESEFFCDDGKSYEYLKNNCVHLFFKVVCTKDKVYVSYKNRGDMPFEPVIRLCGGDCRELVISK